MTTSQGCRTMRPGDRRDRLGSALPRPRRSVSPSGRSGCWRRRGRPGRSRRRRRSRSSSAGGEPRPTTSRATCKARSSTGLIGWPSTEPWKPGRPNAIGDWRWLEGRATPLVAACGGRAMSLDHPAQRLSREATFYLIQAQTGRCEQPRSSVPSWTADGSSSAMPRPIRRARGYPMETFGMFRTRVARRRDRGVGEGVAAGVATAGARPGGDRGGVPLRPVRDACPSARCRRPSRVRHDRAPHVPTRIPAQRLGRAGRRHGAVTSRALAAFRRLRRRAQRARGQVRAAHHRRRSAAVPGTLDPDEDGSVLGSRAACPRWIS